MTRTKKYLLALAVVAVVAGIAAEQTRTPAERAAWDAAGDRHHALQQCVRVFKANAHDPGSVELVEEGQSFEPNADKQSARVTFKVRAKNKMGAKVLTLVRCELERQGESWNVARAIAI